MVAHKVLSDFHRPVTAKSSPHPVLDVVYLYVDCMDNAWRKKHDAHNQMLVTVRHCNMGEIYVSLRTLELYMRVPVKRVFVVTDSQQLDARRLSAWALSRISYVDHRDIIPAAMLPTFNSMVIESFLHLIPGLSDDFLYMNDDMFLASPVTQKDLFDAVSRRPIVYYNPTSILNSKAGPPPNKQWQAWRMNATRLFEYAVARMQLHVRVDFRSNHNAVMLSKRAYTETWRVFGNDVRQSMTRSRTPASINFWFLSVCVAALHGWCALRRDTPAISATVYCRSEAPDRIKRDLHAVVRARPKFLCVNNLNAKCANAWTWFQNSSLFSPSVRPSAPPSRVRSRAATATATAATSDRTKTVSRKRSDVRPEKSRVNRSSSCARGSCAAGTG